MLCLGILPRCRKRIVPMGERLHIIITNPCAETLVRNATIF
ncbi:hypothetical protein [Methanobacterium spitsbergense]|nr:hypothetical protein [Methanobacterium spitsbergense]